MTKARATGVRCTAVAALLIACAACSARPALVGASDAAGGGASGAPRVPICQPGIRETSCTRAPDAGDDRDPADGGGGGADAGLDVPTGSPPDAGPKADASVADGGSACTPSGGATGDVRLLGVEPREATAHASVTFTVTFEGALPSSQMLWVRLGAQLFHLNPNAVNSATSSFKISFSAVSPSAAPMSLGLLTGTDPLHLTLLAWIDCAVQVKALPASPYFAIAPDVDTLAIPLHPELARPCARSAAFELSNRGDDRVTVRSVELTGAPGFTIKDDHCTNQSLAYDPGLDMPCWVTVCFTDTMPGTETASLTFHTNARDVTADLSGVVLPETTGLDRAFAGTGARLLPPSSSPPFYVVRGATLLNNGVSIATWDWSYALLFISPTGDSWSPPLGQVPTVDGFLLSAFGVVRAGGPGQGIFGLVSGPNQGNAGSLIHLFDDGTRDTAFGGTGTIVLEDFLVAAYGGIEIQPSGRALVIGTLYPSYGVRAFAPNGDEDVGYRTAVGNILADLTHGGVLRAIDDRGRLYVATTSGVIRLAAEGGIDPGFTFTGPVEAMAVDRDQHLLVAAAGMLSRLDPAGVASSTPLVQPELGAGVTGIAVDARGRILLTGASGVVLRYRGDGTFDGTVGFFEGGVRAVVCPDQGGCSIAGTLYEGEVRIDRPSGTTLDESYVLRLAP